MSRTEKFSLVSAVVGLVVDILGLVTFALSYKNSTPSVEPSSVLQVAGWLLWGYGWAVLSLLMSRRFYLRRKANILKKEGNQVDEDELNQRLRDQHVYSVIFSTAGMGILLMPVFFLLLSLDADGGYGNGPAGPMLGILIGSFLFFGLPFIYIDDYPGFWDQ